MVPGEMKGSYISCPCRVTTWGDQTPAEVQVLYGAAVISSALTTPPTPPSTPIPPPPVTLTFFLFEISSLSNLLLSSPLFRSLALLPPSVNFYFYLCHSLIPSILVSPLRLAQRRLRHPFTLQLSLQQKTNQDVRACESVKCFQESGQKRGDVSCGVSNHVAFDKVPSYLRSLSPSHTVADAAAGCRTVNSSHSKRRK